MQSTPLVTIITPVYNGAAFLDDLILSVHNQDYPAVEHIIIDDGSTDNQATLNVLQKYPHLRWWSRENRGQYATMNEGLEAAQGEIVCFISADDVMETGAILSAVNALKKNPQCAGVYGSYTIIDENNAPHLYQPLVRHAPVGLYRYLPFIAHCSFYLRKEQLQSNNLYLNPALRFTGDYDWIMRIAEAGLELAFVSQVLSRLRWHSQQTSNTQTALIKAEQAQVWKAHGVNSLIFKIINVGIDRLLVTKMLFMARFNEHKSQDVHAWLASRKGK
jgi:glycosyltransferase involved in cell wall biosynthesis